MTPTGVTKKAIIVLFTLIVSFSLKQGVSARRFEVVQTYRDLRYESVVPQSTWYTCGPAAIATLLTFFFDISTTEADVLDLALGAGHDGFVEAGFSMLALKEALLQLGIESKGYRLTTDALRDYLERGGLPLILHVTRPEAHFVVAVGMNGNGLIVADPSTGLHEFPLASLIDSKGFSGNTLIAIPNVNLQQTAHRRQRDIIQRFSIRRAQLMSLGGRLR